MSRSRLAAALPGLAATAVGTLLWAAAMTASAAAWLAMSERLGTSRSAEILTVFALGGALAFPVALFATRLLAHDVGRERRFAAAFVIFGVASMLGVAFVFSMDYRHYYAEWHAPFPSVVWMFQFVFTGATAVYQFAVLGSRMFFPLGLVALFLVSVWQAAQAR